MLSKQNVLIIVLTSSLLGCGESRKVEIMASSEINYVTVHEEEKYSLIKYFFESNSLETEAEEKKILINIDYRSKGEIIWRSVLERRVKEKDIELTQLRFDESESVLTAVKIVDEEHLGVFYFSELKNNQINFKKFVAHCMSYVGAEGFTNCYTNISVDGFRVEVTFYSELLLRAKDVVMLAERIAREKIQELGKMKQ